MPRRHPTRGGTVSSATASCSSASMCGSDPRDSSGHFAAIDQNLEHASYCRAASPYAAWFFLCGSGTPSDRWPHPRRTASIPEPSPRMLAPDRPRIWTKFSASDLMTISCASLQFPLSTRSPIVLSPECRMTTFMLLAAASSKHSRHPRIRDTSTGCQSKMSSMSTSGMKSPRHVERLLTVDRQNLIDRHRKRFRGRCRWVRRRRRAAAGTADCG